ncbi:MAG: hypothetical protein K2M54_09765 [Muribaculaceae bacterium]|nr:hypothetical protein [Muribaculaceae bacterium]
MMNDFLKDYHIINNLPYGFDFYNQGLRQLRAHSKWFFENKEQRLAELQNAYHAFCGKYLDYTPKSLKSLGKFFLHAIDKEKLSPEEYESKRAQFPPSIPVTDNRMTLRSISLTVDAGIYWGEVMIRNHKNMHWEQYTPRNKRDGDRGYMMITINPHIFKSAVNPMWINRIAAEAIVDRTRTPDRLHELYNYYSEKVSPEFMLDE